jgi:hypothetical protein
MATTTADADCHDGANLIFSAITATAAGVEISTVAEATPTTHYVGPLSSFSIPCQGVVTLTWDVVELSWRALPAPVFPYVDALMGLAGIVCAGLIVWVFNRQ